MAPGLPLSQRVHRHSGSFARHGGRLLEDDLGDGDAHHRHADTMLRERQGAPPAIHFFTLAFFFPADEVAVEGPLLTAATSRAPLTRDAWLSLTFSDSVSQVLAGGQQANVGV